MSSKQKNPIDPWDEESRIRQRQAEYEESRLDEMLTRREIIAAVKSVANYYGCQGHHDSDLICNAFQRLADILQ